MAKKKSGSELEYLRGVVKNQRAIIKNLKKQVSRHDKKAHQYNDLEDKIAEADMIEDEKENGTPVFTKDKCPECSGELEEIDLNIRLMIKCSGCPYRKIVKK